MTIAYYHGAPGAYKTASMVRDWLEPAIKEGRRVLTNIRGVKPSETVAVVPSSKLIEKMFLVPTGTLILIDELGEVFGKQGFDYRKYKATDSALQTDENGEITIIDNLPLLFDKHRHLNLDIIGTAPTIKRVPDLFRAVAEYGYKHKNLATLGIKGFYMQGQHLGDASPNDSNYIARKMKRMPKHIFALYQSTATGAAKDSAISTPLYKHPYVIGMLIALGLAYYFMKDVAILPTTEPPQQVSEDAAKQSNVPPNTDTRQNSEPTNQDTGVSVPADIPEAEENNKSDAEPSTDLASLEADLNQQHLLMFGAFKLGGKVQLFVGDCMSQFVMEYPDEPFLKRVKNPIRSSIQLDTWYYKGKRILSNRGKLCDRQAQMIAQQNTQLGFE